MVRQAFLSEGSFLAVYFVTDVAINRLMNPFATIHQMDREFARMNRDMMFVRELPPNHIRKHNTIDFFRTPDEYKFIIDLKPFRVSLSKSVSFCNIGRNGDTRMCGWPSILHNFSYAKSCRILGCLCRILSRC